MFVCSHDSMWLTFFLERACKTRPDYQYIFGRVNSSAHNTWTNDTRCSILLIVMCSPSLSVNRFNIWQRGKNFMENLLQTKIKLNMPLSNGAHMSTKIAKFQHARTVQTLIFYWIFMCHSRGKCAIKVCPLQKAL